MSLIVILLQNKLGEQLILGYMALKYDVLQNIFKFWY